MKLKPNPSKASSVAAQNPKFPLEKYRQFIREAAPYVSIVIGRVIRGHEADTLSDEEIRHIAILVDQKVPKMEA